MTHLNPFSPLTKALAFGLTAVLLAGCMTPSPYAPRTEKDRTGYTDRELTQTRYRVTFTGNSVTPRETVESYLLLRAAEVTRAAGYSSFLFDTRNTKAHHTVTAIPDGPIGPGWGGYGGWGHRGGFGYWGGFGGWGGYGFGYDPSVDIVVRTNYDAYAEIVMLTPEQAAKEPRALNAADVIAHIGPEAAPKPADKT
jgi:hypothetical protein